jgi:hypothetical protein
MFKWMSNLIGNWKKCDSVTCDNYCEYCKRNCYCVTKDCDIESGSWVVSKEETHTWGC